MRQMTNHVARYSRQANLTRLPDRRATQSSYVVGDKEIRVEMLSFLDHIAGLLQQARNANNTHVVAMLEGIFDRAELTMKRTLSQAQCISQEV